MKEQLISYFKDAIADMVPSEVKTLDDTATVIKLGFKALTELVRLGSTNETELPFITPSGTFSSRKDSDLLSYSGILCIDLDNCNVNVKAILCKDAFLNPALVFVSPSGNGLKVFISIANARVEDHCKYFTASTRYLLDTYQLEADMAYKGVAHACFLCHDPSVYFSKGFVESETLLSILSDAPELLEPESIAETLPPVVETPMMLQLPSDKSDNSPITPDCAVTSVLQEGLKTFEQEADKWTRIAEEHKNGLDDLINQDQKNEQPENEPLLEETMSEKGKNESEIGLLPIEGMPLNIQEYITTCADSFITPRDYWAGSAIMASALAIGDKIELEGKYKNVPILWMNIIGDVSSGKTEAIDQSLKPFEDLDSIAANQFKKDFDEYEAVAAMSAKEKRDAGIDQLTKPTCFQYLVKDSTPEALSQVHSINQRGVMIARDELKGMFDDYNRYNKSGEQSNMLSSFNRISMVTNRKSGGKDSVLLIPKPCLLIFGGMQPDLLPTIANDNRAENGFMARICNVWPDKANKPKYNGNVVPEEIKRRWKEYITAMTELEHPITISMSKKAEDIYQVWFDKNAEISNNEKSGYLKGVYGKLDIIVLRLTVVLYGMQLFDSGENTKQVSAEQMTAAIDITEYFRATALKVYRKIFSKQEEKLGKSQVIHWVLDNLDRTVPEIAAFFRTNRTQVGRIKKKNSP